MTNANGLTLTRWAYAAGFATAAKLPKEAVKDWGNGIDPAEWKVKTSK